MRGRTPRGPEIVHGLQGDPRAKARLQVILQTLAGDLDFTAAARRLQITTQRLHQLRQLALEASLLALAPQPMGRPSKAAVSDPEQIAALRQENERLQRELAASKLREEIAVVLPRRPRRGEKKRATASASADTAPRADRR
jgi:transposase-like protein